MTRPNPFKGFHSSPEIVRLAVMLCVRFPLSLRNVEDLLHERGVEISPQTVRYWQHPLVATGSTDCPPRQRKRMSICTL